MGGSVSNEDIVKMGMRNERWRSLPIAKRDENTGKYTCPDGFFETSGAHQAQSTEGVRRCFPNKDNEVYGFWTVEDGYSLDGNLSNYYSLTSETRNAFLYSSAFIRIGNNKNPYLHTESDCSAQGGLWVKDTDTELQDGTRKIMLNKEKPHHLSMDKGLCIFNKNVTPEYIKAFMIKDEEVCKSKGYSWTNNIFGAYSCFYEIGSAGETDYKSPHPKIDAANKKFEDAADKVGNIVGNVIDAGKKGGTLLDMIMEWIFAHPNLAMASAALFILAPLLTDFAILAP